MTLELRAPLHPLYTGKRKPKGSAASDPDCLELYGLKHPEEAAPFKGTAIIPELTGTSEQLQLDIEDVIRKTEQADENEIS